MHVWVSGTPLQRLVGVPLQRNVAPAARTLVGRHHHPAVRIEDAVAQRIGRETPEHHRVHRTDARAPKHRHHRLGHHRHVHAHTVALLHSLRLQHVGEPAHLRVQLTVRDATRLPRRIPLPYNRRPVTSLGQVTVQAVVRDVHPRSLEPADAHVAFERPVAHPVPLPEPVDVRLGHLGPETLRVRQRTLVHRPVRRIVNQRALGRLRQHLVHLRLRHVPSSNRSLPPAPTKCYFNAAMQGNPPACSSRTVFLSRARAGERRAGTCRRDAGHFTRRTSTRRPRDVPPDGPWLAPAPIPCRTTEWPCAQ